MIVPYSNKSFCKSKVFFFTFASLIIKTIIMKMKVLLLSFMTLLLISCKTKEVSKEDLMNNSELFIECDVPPTYPQGDIELAKFIKLNLKYPKEALEKEIEGKVWCKFFIEIDGTITDIKVVKSLGYGCDEEALRIIKLMPKWIPAKLLCNDNPGNVRSEYTLPIKFELR